MGKSHSKHKYKLLQLDDNDIVLDKIASDDIKIKKHYISVLGVSPYLNLCLNNNENVIIPCDWLWISIG